MEGGVRSDLLGFFNSLRLRLGDGERLRVAFFGNIIFVVGALLDKQDFLGHLYFLVRLERIAKVAYNDVNENAALPRRIVGLVTLTHSLHQDTWLINGVVRQDDISNPVLKALVVITGKEKLTRRPQQPD